jgi:RecG-like helicase
MTSHKLSDSKTRMETMVSTNDGFEIAEVDLMRSRNLMEPNKVEY